MKKVELKGFVKKFLLIILVYILFFIPVLCMSEGVKPALQFLLVIVGMLGGLLIIFLIANLISYIQKHPIAIKGNKYFVREIPKNYSVAVASLLISNVFDESKEIPATILSLIGKSILVYKNKEITVNLNADLSHLNEHEKYICECIFKKKRIVFNNFKNLIINDAINKGYIKKISGKDPLDAAVPQWFLMNIITILVCCFFTWLPSLLYRLVVGVFVVISFSIPIVAGFKTSIEQDNPYKSTKVGKKEKRILLNLKKYLMTFSNIDKKEIEETLLWEDYIAYAYIFGINKKIYNEFEEIKQFSYLFVDENK